MQGHGHGIIHRYAASHDSKVRHVLCSDESTMHLPVEDSHCEACSFRNIHGPIQKMLIHKYKVVTGFSNGYLLLALHPCAFVPITNAHTPHARAHAHARTHARTHAHTHTHTHTHTESWPLLWSRTPEEVQVTSSTRSRQHLTSAVRPIFPFLIRQFIPSGVRHHADQTRRDTEPRRPCPCSTRPSPWPPARYLLHTMPHTTHTTHHTMRHDTMMVDRFTNNVFASTVCGGVFAQQRQVFVSVQRDHQP